jgi:TRAP-type mannitol/chloroaromatic compound transport system permease small subunit
MRSYRIGEVSTNSGGLILWPAKAMLLIAFVMLFWQGISEIIKKIAIMRGVIEDPNPFVSHHEAAELEGAAMVREMEAGLHAGDSREESRK